MNIVLVSSYIIPASMGGIEVLTILLAESLAAIGHNVTIITGGPNKNRKRNNITVMEIPELLLPLHLKGFLMPYYTWRLRRRLDTCAAMMNADVVNAVDIDSILMLAGYKKIQNSFVCTIQDYNLVCANGLLLYGNRVCPNYCHSQRKFLCLNKRKIPFWKRYYLELAYRIRKSYRDKQLKHIDNAICVSYFVAEQIKKIQPAIRTAIIGNCVPNFWRSLPKTNVQKDIDILYAGRLSDFKGVSVFIRSLSLISLNRPLTVAFVGGGNAKKYKTLIDQSQINANISFFETIPFEKIHEYYQRAKIVVVPSVWPEPCGRVIIEGMYWKCVVVSTNQGGTPELIENNVNGVLVKPGNEHDLANALMTLMKNKKMMRRLSDCSASHAPHQYSPIKIAKQYEAYYKNLMRHSEA